MKCDKCGKENKKNAKFCEECGALLEATPEVKPQEKPQKDVVFCEECGKKNKKGVKFCEECGAPIKTEVVNITKEKKPNPLSKLSKKMKIVLGIVLALVIALIVVLFMIFNSPSKKVSKYLNDYYDYYVEDDTTYLASIAKVYSENKNNAETIEEIKQTIKDIIETWIEDFNNEFNDTDELYDEYTKIADIIYNIYDYSEGNLLSYDEYYDYVDELYDMYYSKYYYLTAKDYEKSGNESSAYYYYSKVIESDCYYESAQEFISEYLSDEIENYQTTVKEMLEGVTDTNEGWLSAYIEVLDYLEDNDYVNGIDFTSVSEYKELLADAKSKIVSYTKLVVEDYVKDYNYADALSLISSVMKYFDNDSDEYTELSELYDQYKSQMPDSLLDQYMVEDDEVYEKTSSITINEVEYDNALRFAFEGKTQYVIYRLNGDYTKLKTTIVRGENWDKSYSGYFVIYGDDVEIYRSSEITKSNEVSLDINLDITGVDDLKIEFVTSSGDDSFWSDKFYIYLVEPYLYK